MYTSAASNLAADRSGQPSHTHTHTQKKGKITLPLVRTLNNLMVLFSLSRTKHLITETLLCLLQKYSLKKKEEKGNDNWKSKTRACTADLSN